MLISTTTASIWVSIWHTQNKHRFRGEIVISNDSDFERKFHLPGSGTKSDPYRIEFLQIITTRDFGIKIRDTTSYFVIRNCSIRARNTAIHLTDVGYSTALISNNTVAGITGILAINCYEVLIDNNVCEHAIYGIALMSCLNSTIMNNYCLNLTYGIYLEGNSSNCIVSNNHLESNKEAGLLYNYWDQIAFDVSFSYNVLISNNTCINNKVGLDIAVILAIPLVALPTFILVSNNCSLNEDIGIAIRGYYVQAINNYCGFNGDVGITGWQLKNSTLTNNHLQNNTSFGIALSHTSGCNIYHNNFFENNIDGPILMNAQAFDDSTIEIVYGQNVWYNSISSEGNHWSDLVWAPGITYDISGSNNADFFPLEFPYG